MFFLVSCSPPFLMIHFLEQICKPKMARGERHLYEVMTLQVLPLMEKAFSPVKRNTHGQEYHSSCREWNIFFIIPARFRLRYGIFKWTSSLNAESSSTIKFSK